MKGKQGLYMCGVSFQEKKKQQALIEKSSNIKGSRRQRDEVCVLIVQWSFQYFNQGRAEETEGVTSLTSLIVLL